MGLMRMASPVSSRVPAWQQWILEEFVLDATGNVRWALLPVLGGDSAKSGQATNTSAKSGQATGRERKARTAKHERSKLTAMHFLVSEFFRRWMTASRRRWLPP